MTEAQRVVDGAVRGPSVSTIIKKACDDVFEVTGVNPLHEIAKELEKIVLEASLKKAESRGKIESADAVLARIAVVEAIESMADRQLVVEAIVEDEDAKTALFRRLDDVMTDPEAILASAPPRSRS